MGKGAKLGGRRPCQQTNQLLDSLVCYLSVYFQVQFPHTRNDGLWIQVHNNIIIILLYGLGLSKHLETRLISAVALFP